MIQNVVTSIILYSGTAVDLLIILMLFFAKRKSRKDIINIYLGQFLGSVSLIFLSLLFAFVLNYILISHDETISQYFFIPLSKRLNSKSNLDSKYAYCNLIARLLGKINDGVSLGVFELSLQESYRLYLDLIEQIVEVLNDETDNCFHLVGDDKQKVEMALFMKFNEYEEKVKAWRLTDD